MFKKKSEEIKEVEVSKEVSVPNCTHLAFGINRVESENGSIYELVEIKYDPLTKQTGEVTVLSKDVFEDIADRFKMVAAEKMLTRNR